MIVGSLGGLTQNNIKRLLAYSSIANVGHALVAVAAGQVLGRDARAPSARALSGGAS